MFILVFTIIQLCFYKGFAIEEITLRIYANNMPLTNFKTFVFKQSVNIQPIPNLNAALKTIFFIPDIYQNFKDQESLINDLAKAFQELNNVNFICFVTDRVSTIDDLINIGNLMAEFFEKFKRVQEMKNIKIIGYGYGVHVIRVIYLNGITFFKATGLNPTALTKTDNALLKNTFILTANFTDVIYTEYEKDSTLVRQRGYATFYVNFKTELQPYCVDNREERCPQKMAIRYYTESVKERNKSKYFYIASHSDKDCPTKSNTTTLKMGYYIDIDNAVGIYLLKTSAKPDFNRGYCGMHGCSTLIFKEVQCNS